MSKVYVSARLPKMLVDAIERYKAGMKSGPWGKVPNRSDAIRELLNDGLLASGHLKESKPKRRRR